MGQIKNIKLHIVTDIKDHHNNTMCMSVQYEVSHRTYWVPEEKMEPFSTVVDEYYRNTVRKETIKVEEMDSVVGCDNNNVRVKSESAESNRAVRCNDDDNNGNHSGEPSSSSSTVGNVKYKDGRIVYG